MHSCFWGEFVQSRCNGLGAAGDHEHRYTYVNRHFLKPLYGVRRSGHPIIDTVVPMKTQIEFLTKKSRRFVYEHCTLLLPVL